MNKKYLSKIEELIKIVNDLDKLNSEDKTATEKDNNFINHLVIITKNYYFDDEEKIKLVITEQNGNFYEV